MKLNLAIEQLIQEEQDAELALTPEAEAEVEQVLAEPVNDVLKSAEDQLETIMAARVEEAVEETDEAVEEGQDVADRTAEIGNEIQKDNEAGGLSLESLVLAQFAINHATRPTGLEVSLMGVGLESLDPNAKHTVAMEGLGEFLGRVGDTLARMVQGALPELARAASAADVRVHRIRHHTSKLLGQLMTMRGQTATGDYRTVEAMSIDELTIDGQINGVVNAGLQDLLALTKPIFESFEEKADEAFRTNLKLARAVQYDTMENFNRSYHNAAVSFVDPRKLIPGKLTRRTLGERLFFADTDSRYSGTNADAKRFDAFATKAVPTRILQRKIKDETVEGAQRVEALTPEAMIKALVGLHTATRAAGVRRSWWAIVGANPVSNIILFPIKIHRRLKIIDPGSGGVRAQVMEERRAMARALDISNYMRFRVRLDATLSLMSVAEAYLILCRRSIKAIQKSAVVKP